MFDTTCIFLGPYRNLTSLTASVLSLHPSVQVLNHGGERIFDNPNLNIFSNPSDETYQNLCEFLLGASSGMRRGYFGGSILKANAYKRGTLKKLYLDRFGDAAVKEKIKCFVWKESQRCSYQIRKNEAVALQSIENHQSLRFLMPVRNPLDCAYSNFVSGKYTIFFTGHSASKPYVGESRKERLKHKECSSLFIERFEQIINVLISEYLFFLNLRKRYQNRFFFFCENEISRDLMSDLADFLRISQDERWINDSLSTFSVEKKYQFPDSLNEKTIELIQDRLGEFNDFKYRIINLLEKEAVV